MVLALPLTHVVVGAVLLVLVVGDEAILLRALQLFLVCVVSGGAMHGNESLEFTHVCSHEIRGEGGLRDTQ